MSHVTVEVEVSLSEIDTDELVHELKSRDYEFDDFTDDDVKSLLYQIYQLKRNRRSYEHLLDELIKDVLGVAVV
jgi:hypothetical protein